MDISRIVLSGLTSIALPIFGALPNDRYILKSVDGLGPPEVDVLISDRGFYQGRRPQNREIVLKIGFNAHSDYGLTPADLRQEFYGLLTPYGTDALMSVFLQDNNNQTLLQTQGYIKRIEPVMFSKEPEIQVVIACLGPYLQGPSNIGLSSYALRNPTFNNPGTAPTGFFLEGTMGEDAGVFWIRESSGKQLYFFSTLVAGDTVQIDTRPGHRKALKNGQNMIAGIAAGSVWPMMYRGEYQLLSSSPMVWREASFFVPEYWGV